MINHNKAQLTVDLQTLRQGIYESKREIIKAQVKQLLQQVIYEKNSTEYLLKNDIKEHVYQAHAIATNIYNNNKDKSEQEVTLLIKNALRNIRFSQGRGYFFIYKTDGLSILHPILPAMEGTASMIDLQDVRGNYIVRDLGHLTKKNGEAFYRWWFVKPDITNQEFEKIGFGKHFVPYDWFIGTGEYLIDVENDIKQRLIQRISNFKYGLNGYISLLDYQGNVLSHYRKDFEGTNLNDHEDSSIIEVNRQFINIAKQDEGFLSYVSPLMPSTGKPAEKTSFIEGFKQWKWVIVTGFYKSETDKYLRVREQKIKIQNKEQLKDLLWFSIFVILLFFILSLVLTRYLARHFTLYEDKINDDIKEIKLAQANKMSSLETFTAGVAHEINNPTNFAHAAIYMMGQEIEKIKIFLKQLAGGDDAEEKVLLSFENKFSKLVELVKTASEGTVRIKTIVKDLRSFGHLDDTKYVKLNISELINSTISLVETQYNDILIEVNFKDDPHINCIPSKLKQVIMNIIVNSCQAIHMKPSPYKTANDKIMITTYKKESNIYVCIKDNGCGMSDEVRMRIFDPFYTTKEVGKGTGLGMAISFGIIEEHGGSIHIESSNNKGTTIILILNID
jgi:signal transduction histidine kinase